MKGKRLLRPKHVIRHQERDAVPDGEEIISSEIAELQKSEDEARLSSASLPAVAIVGRPNVGKSSLFNAILHRRQAIVHFDSGVTRDRVCSSGVFDGCRFNLIDTGGLGMYGGEKKAVGFWDKLIAEQVDAAVKSAEAIIFVVDAQAGLTPLDENIASRIRTCGKRVVLAVNKSDNESDELHGDEFCRMGFDRTFKVSCLHRRGISELLSEVVSGLPKTGERKGPPPLRIAVLGRPNVGKSSLVNMLLGEDRVIVSDVAGTTRDAIDAEFILRCGEEKVPSVIVDTAGLRKKSKIDGAVEQYSMMRAQEALKTCDIVLFVIESSVGEATSQDKTIAGMIEESGKGCIIVANKWDIKAEGKKTAEMLADVRWSLPKMKYAPVVFMSAKTKYNSSSLYEAIALVRGNLNTKISTATVNKVIQDAYARNLPPVVGLKPLKMYYGTMAGTTPPKFVIFVNKPEYCADTYKAYLVNCFRKAFDLSGFPIVIQLEERSRRDLSEVVNHAGSTHRKKAANAKQKKEAKREFLARKKYKAAENRRNAKNRGEEE